MSDKNSLFVKLQAILNRTKSIANINKDIKAIAAKLSKINIKGTLNKTSTGKELNQKIKSIQPKVTVDADTTKLKKKIAKLKPKVKIDADTTAAQKKIAKLSRPKKAPPIQPAIDSSSLDSQLKDVQKKTNTLWSRISSGIESNLIRMSVQKVTDAIHQAFETVKALDTIKTGLQMASGVSDTRASTMMSSYNAMAKDLSSTTREVAETATEFLRMGESIETANDLIQSSQILSKIGMINSADAANYLMSCLKGYDVAANSSIHVVSKLTSVDQEAAVSAGGLAEAISICSAIANTSGTSLDRLIGYTAAVGEVTQESMSSVGNSFKSIYGRMNSLKLGKLVDGETGESLSDTETVLNSLGIRLRDTSDAYRAFDDVLDDIGTRWKQFTQTEQNAISVAIAGSAQRSSFLALMENWTTAMGYSETAANSAGNALERYGIYQYSIEAKCNELTAALESLATNTLSEELYGGILDATTGIVEFLDKTNLLKGSLAGLMTMGISKAFISIAAKIITTAKSTSQLAYAMSLLKKDMEPKNFIEVGKACVGLSNKQLKLVLSTKSLGDAERQEILKGLEADEQKRKQILTTLGFAQAQEEAAHSTFSFKGAFQALKTAIAVNPFNTIAFLGSLISLASVLFQTRQHASEKANELYEESNALVQQNKETVESLNTLIAKYKELRKKGNLDLEGRNEIKGIQNDIADLVGAQAKNLDLVNGKLDAQIEKLDELSEKEAKRAYQDAQVNYYNAKEAATKASPAKARVFFTDYDYAGKIEIEARKALAEAGFASFNSNGHINSPGYGSGFGQDGVMGTKMVVKAVGETAQEKYDYLQRMIFTLEQYDQKNTEIYRGLIHQIGEYEGYINQHRASAESLMNSWITISQYANQKLSGITVDSVTAFERYRKVMIKEAKKDKSIGVAMADGMLSHEDIVKSVDAFMATTEGFSEWYVKWQNSMNSNNHGSLSTFDLSSYKDQIDDIQSSITTLRSALESLNKGELAKLSVIDLLQEFPSLAPYIDLAADGFGNLSKGLNELIKQQPDELLHKLNDLKAPLSTEEERQQVDLFIDSLQRLSSYGDTGIESYAAAIGDTWNGTENVIEGVTTQFENLAKVQEAVADGLTITAAKATELAKLYPEILTNAKVSADGQITLNEEVVNGILAGDQSIIKGQIAKLEADKAELEARKAYAEAQLDIIKQVGEGQGQITKETAQYAIETADKELKALIDMGNEQDKAYAEVAENMAANIDEYNRIVAQAALDSSLNMDNSAVAMAESIDKNMRNAQRSVNAFIQKSHDMADAIQKAKSGERGGNLEIHQGGGSTKGKEIKTNIHTGNFNSTLSEYTPKEIDLDDFQSNLALDIQHYADAISNIDAQIEILKNLQSTFENNGGVDGNGYIDKIKQLEEKKDTINNSIKPNQETVETFNWIETALSRIQRVIKNLGNTVSSTWNHWTTRNSALASELSEVRKEIELQKSAYDNYKAKADSMNLPNHYKELVRNGALSIEDITDSTLKEQIKSYKEYYEKALSCKDAVSELKDKLAELAQLKFDHISTQYDAKIQDIDHTAHLIKGELDIAETKNTIAGQSFYTALLSAENSKIETLTKEYREKLAAMNDAVSSGSIHRGSEAWQKMKSDIDSVAESIQEANNQALGYEKSIKEIAELKFDSLETQFGSALSIITTEISQLDKQMALMEEAGYLAGESFYNTMIESERTHTEALIEEYKTLSSSLKEAVDNGSVTKFDETWYDMTGSIHSVEDALLDAQTALIKYGSSLRELEWDVFDRTLESIRGITEESGFLIDLMGSDATLHNENGTFNAKGLSVQGLHAINYDVYMGQAKEYADAIGEINRELANDPNNIKLQDRYKELLSLQREAVLNAEDEKSAVKDLISEGYDKMLSFFDRLISARKQALSDEKNLHDYEKTIADQTAEVAKYQKILDAYQGDDSEGMKAAIQKAQESLANAWEELNETEYDKYMSDQEALLDTFKTELEEWVNIRLDDINGLFHQAIDATNANAQVISGQISADLTAVGMTLTENFTKLFEIDYSGGVKEIVSGFLGNDGSFSMAMTTVSATIGELKAKSDELKISTDQVGNILNQRFPELAQSMPKLAETNSKIGEVTGAISLVKEAITAIHTDMAKLELDLPEYGGENSGSDNDDGWDHYQESPSHDLTVTYTPPQDSTPTNTSTNGTKGHPPNASLSYSGGKGVGGKIKEELLDIRFYKNGYHRLPNDQIACTQEDGTEFILSPSRGGILTPLCKGDSVLTAEESDRLYTLSQLSPEELHKQFFQDYTPETHIQDMLRQTAVPVNHHSTSTNNDVTVNITIPNITNKDEFGQYLRSNENVRFIKGTISDALQNKNSLNWHNY